MATPLLDAMIGKIVGDMDGDKKTERQLVQDHIKRSEQQLVQDKLETLGLIRTEIETFNDSTPASVRTAYEKLLAQALGQS